MPSYHRKVQSKIMGVLRDWYASEEVGITTDAIAKRVPITSDAARRHLTVMRDKGQVIRTVYNDPFRVEWHLPDCEV